jgi:NADH-quinone oxidoreductase subunit G
MFNYLNLQKEKSSDTKNIEKNDDADQFKSETLKIQIKDYYFSNVIARSSKTMIECNNSKINLKSTGTEG